MRTFIITISLIVIVFIIGILSNNKTEEIELQTSELSADSIQAIWDDYYSTIRQRRVKEVEILNDSLRSANISKADSLYLDFNFFTPEKSLAESLENQLKENYSVSIREGQDGYWFLEGTTRPALVNITFEDHTNWVKFMTDVGISHNCVFITWSITNKENNRTWSSEKIETGIEVNIPL